MSHSSWYTGPSWYTPQIFYMYPQNTVKERRNNNHEKWPPLYNQVSIFAHFNTIFGHNIFAMNLFSNLSITNNNDVIIHYQFSN